MAGKLLRDKEKQQLAGDYLNAYDEMKQAS
jgi:hypothetical protein